LKSAIDNGIAVRMKPGEIIEAEIVAVAYQAKGIKRITLEGAIEPA
jgi:hypothetical protein